MQAKDALNHFIEIAESRASDSLLEILISPNVGQLYGVVVDSRSQPAPGVRVVLVPEKNRDRSELYSPVTSDQSGHCMPSPCCILNRMAQYSQTHFDASFAALSDATRRGVLEQLGRADASITALAERFHMTLTGMKKHVGVLEQAGLVSTEKVGRVRTCKLGLRGLEEEAAWIERYRQLWAARFDELDIVVEELKRKEKANGRKKRK